MASGDEEGSTVDVTGGGPRQLEGSGIVGLAVSGGPEGPDVENIVGARRTGRRPAVTIRRRRLGRTSSWWTHRRRRRRRRVSLRGESNAAVFVPPAVVSSSMGVGAGGAQDEQDEDEKNRSSELHQCSG